MSEKAHSLKGVMYGMTRMCLSDNTVKNVYSSVFVMSGKNPGLEWRAVRCDSDVSSFRQY